MSGSTEVAQHSRVWGAAVVPMLFFGNELAVTLTGPSMVYVAFRAAVIPIAATVYVGATVWEMLRSKSTGRPRVESLVGIAVAVGIFLFQWFSSFPLFLRPP